MYPKILSSSKLSSKIKNYNSQKRTEKLSFSEPKKIYHLQNPYDSFLSTLLETELSSFSDNKWHTAPL